ncbi:CYTH domain-containing protein [Cytobacillus sp. FJAT-54145]|uniref:CYTH domain-containing protein n=1 Tax=Cytobacillus spartinae TaxID=3299023 RepID=A0ABW6KBV1_9BACI
MSQNIEIEFKNLLTQEEFTKLKSFFQIEDSMFVKQINHYFDTPTFSLKELGCALRIREKNSTYEMTLKQPALEGLLETNQTLTSTEADVMLKTGLIPDGAVKDQLDRLNIALQEIVYFGSLSTERAETEYLNGLIVLDYSSYLNHHDYELEYEVNHFETGEKHFLELLHTLDIPVRKTDNKIRRFYHALKKLR